MRVACLTCLLLIPELSLAKTTEQHLTELGELAIPDLRIEWGEALDGAKVIISVPIAITLPAIALFERGSDSTEVICEGHHMVVLPRLLLEPQRQVTDGDWRLLAGARATILQPASGLAVAGEGFGLIGEDVDGAAGGIGASIGYGGWLFLSYRHTWTPGAPRHDLSLDFRFFSLPYGRHTDQVDSARAANRCRPKHIVDQSLGLIPAPFSGHDETDKEPPTLVHNPCGFRPGQNLEVRVEIFDASAVFVPSVVYWIAGSGQQRQEMSRVGQSHRFVAALPTQGTKSVSYYIEAFDVLAHGPGLAGSLEEPVIIRSQPSPAACGW